MNKPEDEDPAGEHLDDQDTSNEEVLSLIASMIEESTDASVLVSPDGVSALGVVLEAVVRAWHQAGIVPHFAVVLHADPEDSISLAMAMLPNSEGDEDADFIVEQIRELSEDAVAVAAVFTAQSYDVALDGSGPASGDERRHDGVFIHIEHQHCQDGGYSLWAEESNGVLGSFETVPGDSFGRYSHLLSCKRDSN